MLAPLALDAVDYEEGGRQQTADAVQDGRAKGYVVPDADHLAAVEVAEKKEIDLILELANI